MYYALITYRRLRQCGYIKCVILLLKKDGLPVDAPRYDMLRKARDEVARLTRHTRSLGIAFPPGRAMKMRFDPIFAIFAI